MSFSEDEDDIVVPECVNNYQFLDGREEPTCFSALPFQWEPDQSLDDCEKEVFLHGDSEDGLQKVYKQVSAWKLALDSVQPVVHVLSKEEKWIKLVKPRKSFVDTIRSIMVTIHCIHYLKRNPESTKKSLWNHLRKVFSHFEAKVSPYDIMDHVPFIRKMIEREDISISTELMTSLLSESVKKKNALPEDLVNNKSSDFINDDVENEEINNDARDDEEEDGFGSVCAICDEGGNLLCCDGKCLRSFHGTKKSGRGSQCRTLGFTKEQVDATPIFQCLNCRYNQHQCFACGRLGSSKSENPEVYICANVYCGRFYHPSCVSKLLHKQNETDAAELENKIAEGQKFICPFHRCTLCKKGEDKQVKDLQFAMCLRCPTSYHRKCLPSEIADDEGRIWTELLKNRILIYCMRHEIDEDLGTPARNHLIFPNDPLKEKVLRKTVTISSNKRKAENLCMGKDTSGVATKIPKLEGDSNKIRKVQTSFPVKKAKISSDTKLGTSESEKFQTVDGIPGKDKTRALVVESRRNERPSSPTLVMTVRSPVVDKEIQKRVLALVQKSTSSSLTLPNFIKTKMIPLTHVYNAKVVDQTITLGKVEGSIEALQTALQKIDEDNGNIENAKDVCDPGILEQMMKWRNKLAVYLGPFLHGMLYTSFGRHFTKIDKLKEIVDRLHWYVESGDMIVDFCCGANDFSILMKGKLEATGKQCQYRNYDVIPPRNDFNFVKKDWMTVRHSELPNGSQLIMGLNPPFGVKAALANKFINKALEFKPKLLILIVPKETQRLDEKAAVEYDLVWMDETKLSGKAFYLPGTVDANDKQLEQWNNQPPPLYLWSRHDWTAKHINIALEKGHKTNKFDKLSDEIRRNASTENHLEENDVCISPRLDGHLQTEQSKKEKGEEVAPSSRETNFSALKPNNRPEDSRFKRSKMRKVCTKKLEDSANKRSKEKTYNDKEKKKSPSKEELDKLSDMSISPSRETDGRNPRLEHSPKVLEGHLEEMETSSSMPSKQLEFGAKSARFQTSSFRADDQNNIDLLSSSRREVPFLSDSFGRSEELLGYKKDASFVGYGERIRHAEDRLLGQDAHPQIGVYGRQGIPDPLNSYERERGYEIPSQVRPYVPQDFSNFPPSHERDLGGNMHSLSRDYGQGNSELPRNRYTFGSSLATSPYKLSDPGIGTSSTIDRYAPRLDEPNRLHALGLGSSSMEKYNPRLDVLNSGLPFDQHAHSSQQAHLDSISFTTRYNGSYSQQGSSGWFGD